MSPGLLQLTAVRHQRRTTSMPAVGGGTLPPAWSQAPVDVTTSHQCYGSCTGCQSVSTLCSRSRGSYISRLVDWLSRTSQTTVAFCRPLRSNSNDMRKLLVPRTHNKLGDRSFSAAGPRLWNDLPSGLRRPGLTFDSFRQSLKTHLFGDRSA